MLVGVVEDVDDEDDGDVVRDSDSLINSLYDVKGTRMYLSADLSFFLTLIVCS